MSRVSRPGARLVERLVALTALVAVVALVGCGATGDTGETGGGGDEVSDAPDGRDARAALEAQRASVRGLGAALAADAAAAIDGVAGEPAGRFVGCTPVFPEGHRDFRYTLSVRVDAGAAAPASLLGAVRWVLDAAGVAAEPGERPGGRTLGGPGPDGVDVRLSELPAQGRYLLLDLAGPCVEVPAEDRDAWEGRVG